VELWAAGVPRVQIAEELGFSRKKFDAEVERLRREGEERLAYRPGVD
jgi:biotin operon repressor